MSPASKAQQKAVNKYMKENYDRVIARFGDIVRKMQESEKEHE